MKMLFGVLLECVLLVCSVCGSSAVANPATPLDAWPQWRGPTGSGVAAAGHYPAQFSATENVLWKIALPGRGSSTPAVWGEQIFVTCPIEQHDAVVAYDFQGKLLWSQSLGPERAGKHRHGTGCNPSPVTDGQSLVVYFKSGTLAHLDLGGNVRWQVNLQDQYGEDTLWWDLGTSPVLTSELVLVAVMHTGESFLVALDRKDGHVVWKQSRNFPCPAESDQSYTTPQLLTLEGQEVLVTWGADHLTGHAVATGELLWESGGFNPDQQRAWRTIASAAVDDEVAIVPYGRGQFLAAIDLRHAQGSLTADRRLWEKVGLGADVPTPILDGKRLLVLTDKGVVYGLDKQTGEELWSERLPRAKAKYFASPILAGNTLVCAREDGVLMTATLGDDFTQGLQNVQANDLEEAVIATPVAVRNQLLVRGENHLFLIANPPSGDESPTP